MEHCLLNNWILHGNQWNRDLVRDLVTEEDAEIILSLKLCTAATQDFLGWHYTEDGIYSVKSAYWLANQVFMDPEIQPPPGKAEIKAKIWKLKTAPKIKHFLWKLLSGALATGDNLKRRHIRNHPQCHRCCQEDETSQHLFFDCFYAQQVWRASGIPHQELRTTGITMETKMELLLSSCLANRQPQLFNLAIWILWRLWKSRNQLVFQQKSISWQNTLQRARNDVQEWEDTNTYVQSLNQQVHSSRHQQPTMARTKWQRPPSTWIKYNYDGAFNHQTRNAKAGWLMRDENGVYMGSGQAIGSTTSDSLESEFQALIIAMQHAWSQGYRKVIFEGDSKQVEELMNNEKLNFGRFNWIREGRFWQKRFEEAVFKWVPRTNNQPADILAKHHLQPNQSFKFHYYVPAFITSTLYYDH